MQLYKAENILTPWFVRHNTPVQEVTDSFINNSGVKLFVKREDMNHPHLSGNKWHKLKYNLTEAFKQKQNTLLTFGGAYSNHIYATAAAGKLFGFRTIGLIRGEEHLPLNPTLRFAVSMGMEIHYLSRTDYRRKTEIDFINSLKTKFGRFYLIPEGGTNRLAVKGTSEIFSKMKNKFDYYCCACGTGGTLAGLILGLQGNGKALGFSVLKGAEFLKQNVEALINPIKKEKSHVWEILLNYHFGGYAKINKELIYFCEKFQKENNIPVEPIYTGKIFFGIYDLISKGFFNKGDSILALHTGGLQGLEGMKERIDLIKKKANNNTGQH